MSFFEILFIFKWWLYLFLVGIVFLPITFSIFSNFKDKGYIFSKTISLFIISYSVFVLSSIKLLKFSIFEIGIVLIAYLILNFLFYKKTKLSLLKIIKKSYKIILIEEIIFLSLFIFWTFVRGNLPEINGLEKFMDFGFLNSILKSEYFPPKDMWYSGFSINYYYFGHLVTAMYLKLTGIPSYIGYNLMLAFLFSLTFTSSFSIAYNFFDAIGKKLRPILSGFLSAIFVTLGGNLVTIYTFFKPYQNENPVPFWNLVFSPSSFPNNFWYPNATRFIPYTIHEFPLYSFVVSDLHGHVLDIPLVLFTIAFTLSIFLKQKIKKIEILFLSLILSIMYMTNAWDGLIYMLLTIMLITILTSKKIYGSYLNPYTIYNLISKSFILFLGFFAFSLPFSINFKPFVSGVGVLCAPDFLVKFSKIGPFLFEADHCQKSPIWQLIILYGFFYFFVASFLLFLKFKKKYQLTLVDKFVLVLILLSTILIIVPEFIYVKDIYPMHYRANTMFKLVYEAFIMLSLSSGYIVIKLITSIKNKKFLFLFFAPSIFLIYFIIAYPVFAVGTFYNNLKSYTGLDGQVYLKTKHPNDFKLIQWINENIKGQPVILEASGDSYTDYARISANTGLPTVIGWSVHEWLWRGTYDIVAPRINDVQTIYTSHDLNTVKI